MKTEGNGEDNFNDVCYRCVNGNGSGSGAVVGYDIGGVEASGSAAR